MADKKKSSPRRKTDASPKKTPGKKAPGKTAGTRKKKKADLGKELKKVFLGIAILLAICLTLAMMADIFFKPGNKGSIKKASQPLTAKRDKVPIVISPKEATRVDPVFEDPDDIQNKKPIAGIQEKTQRPILYEIFEDLDHAQEEEKPVPPVIKNDIPSIVIIIDDIGYDRQVAMELYQLNSNLTFSVLPFSPFGRSIAKKLSEKGAQLMLHLPMEPVEYPEVNPGPGALLSSMTPDKLLDQLRKNLIEVPGVVGVNNHMGSKLTADSDKMNQIFTILKKQDLFFIDSRTSPVSRGEESARLFKLRFAQRDIFLDNSQNIPYITGQFGRLIKIAQKHGIAIGIGHPYKSTLEALKIELPKLNGKIRIVPASQAVVVLE